MRSWLVTWRISRTEILLMVLATVAVSAISLGLIIVLGAVTPGCLKSAAIRVADCADTRAFFDVARIAGGLVVGFAGLPPAVGAVLGAQLVAREIEHGTAPFSWTIARSRVRWLIEATLALGLVVVVMLIPMAVIGHLLTGAVDPSTDPASSLDGFGYRGPALLMRGITMFSIGILLGALTGRILPALLIAAFPAVLLIAFGTSLGIAGMPAEVIGRMGQPLIANSFVFDERFEAEDGALKTVDEAYASAPAGTDPEGWVEYHFRRVAIGIPARRYPEVEVRSTVALAIISLLVWAAALGVVERRRPY